MVVAGIVPHAGWAIVDRRSSKRDYRMEGNHLRSKAWKSRSMLTLNRT